MTPGTWVGRRDVVRTTLLGLAGAACVGGRTRADRPAQDDATVTVEDQQTDGDSIVVAEIATDVDASLFVRNVTGDTIGGSGVHFDAGESATDVTVALDEPLTESQTVTVTLLESNAGEIASDEAFVSIDEDQEIVEGMDATLIEPGDADPFNYPYFLYAPDSVRTGPVPILVEPNNTGTSTDDYAAHRGAARDLVEDGGTIGLSRALGVPLLVPVFPRPRNDPVNWRHYVHQLDRDTLAIDDGPLERVDLQLLAMVDDAREHLAAQTDYVLRDEIAMNGFSASGNFVDRFAVLHPDRVLSVTAGGLNGMGLLPQAERDGRELRYHVGIADVEELTGDPVDLDALAEVDQFLYMGAEDDNDTIPYDDAWTDDDLRETALQIYGEDMIEDRFPTCQAAYEEAGVEAEFRVYADAGHTPRPAREDVVEFHRRSIEGEDVSGLGEDLTSPVEPDPAEVTATIDVESTTATVGEPIAFDASGSEPAGTEIRSYTWDFDDGETAAGDAVTHAFDDPGRYTVSLEVVDDTGAIDRAEVDVEAADGGGAASEDADEDDVTDEDDGTPGFGLAGAVGSLGGVAYLLGRRGERGDP